MTGEAAFSEWAWRIPFLLSIVLVMVSFYIRRQLGESPLYAKLKAQGGASTSPIKESFNTWSKWKLILIILFGVPRGSSDLYTSQFYALFLSADCSQASANATYMIARRASSRTPLFVLSGTCRIHGSQEIMIACNLPARVVLLPVQGIFPVAWPSTCCDRCDIVVHTPSPR